MVKRETSGHTRYSTASASIESPPASGVETAVLAHSAASRMKASWTNLPSASVLEASP